MIHDTKEPLGSAPIRVLVLDDEEPIRRLLTMMLRQSGFHVESAESGRAGLRILLHRDFDVALVDLQMPDMDGASFLQEARGIWPWLGIIILSGHINEEARLHALRHNVTRVVHKPIDMRLLLDTVRAEAEEKKRLVELTAAHSLDHIQDQLGLLRQFGETALEADSIEAAMTVLGSGLCHLLACDAAAVLNVQQDEQTLHLVPAGKVSQEFIRALEAEAVQRHATLSGGTAPDGSLRAIFDPAQLHPDGGCTIGSTFTVPLIRRGVVHGLLLLAAVRTEAFGPAQAAFLYHAAAQIGTVLAALAHMRRLAVRDVLTGLYNRRGLDEEFNRIWFMSRRYTWPIGLAIIDLDHFKSLNDTQGHLLGDEMLKEFALLVRKASRESDIIGRYGGDEVVVVLPQAGAADCLSFAERLLHATRQHVFCEASLGGIHITVSIGLSTGLATVEARRDDLFARADEALYDAKQQGRNQVRIRHPSQLDETSNPAPAASQDPSRCRGRILVVDDDPAIGLMLGRLLRKHHYEVHTEDTADGALEALKRQQGRFDILLTDLNMPGKGGLALLDELRTIDEDIIKIVISGEATADNAITSLRRGAYDFIEKPISTDQLTATLDRALEYRRLKQDNLRYQHQLEDMVREKSAALREALDRVRSAYDFTLEAMASLLDAREKSTSCHSIRVRDYAVRIAHAMKLSPSEVEHIARGALLHDIGKMAIPDAILLKPGPLTEDEWAVMRTHPEVGYRLLKNSPGLEPVSELVYSHHERYDGSGYPRGLCGEDISLGARIFALADAYDAMRSNRHYRMALSPERALDEILQQRGHQFDPAVVDAFTRCQDELEAAAQRAL